MNGRVQLCVWAVTLCVSFASRAIAQQHRPLSYDVDGVAHVARGEISGHVSCLLQTDPKEPVVTFWLLPDRLRDVPDAMDRITARSVFPGEIDLGGITVTDVTVNGGRAEHAIVTQPARSLRGRDAAGSDLAVTIPRSLRGNQVRVSVRFVLSLPKRFGRLGRAKGQWSLLAPWYPIVVRGDAFSFRVPHRLRLVTDSPMHIVAAGRRLRQGETSSIVDAYVPVTLARQWFVRERAIGEGATVKFVSAFRPYDPPPPSASGLEALREPLRVDVVARTVQVLRRVHETFRFARGDGFASSDAVVVFPSRTELAARVPGMVLISDRLFQVVPLPLALGFHERALSHAAFEFLSDRELSSRDAVEHRGWISSLRAAFFDDLHRARLRKTAKSVQEIIGWAAFNPAIDQLLYAQQVTFRNAYFGWAPSELGYREDPLYARVPITRGKALLRYLRQYLPPARFRELALDLTRASDVRDRILKALGDNGRWLSAWLAAASKRVNYRLSGVRSQRHPSGYDHEVEVLRVGEPRVEPVEVLFETIDGQRLIESVVVEDDKTTVSRSTRKPLRRVMIDPHGYTQQSGEVSSGHPRRDDTQRHPWRPPLLRAFGLNYLGAEGEVTGFVDFVMRRRFDLENAINVFAQRSTALAGVTARFIGGMGPKRHSNGRVGFWSAGASVDRLDPNFSEEGDGAWRVSGLVSGGFDTRNYLPDPRDGASLVGSVRFGSSFRDHSAARFTGSASLRGAYVVPVGLRRMFLLVGAAGYSFGDPLPSEQQRAGGQFRLRAYQTDELVSRGLGTLVVEHRWTPIADLAVNLAHLAWLREIQLAVFGGVGAQLETLDGPSLRTASEVGGGVRFHFEYGGVQPALFLVDVAYPIQRRDNDEGADGVLGRDRAPVTFYLSFSQYF